MREFTLSGAAWFDRSPEPVFVLQDGVLYDWNAAAKALISQLGWQLSEGQLAPEELRQLAEISAAEVPLGQRRWNCLSMDIDLGRLIRLTPVSEDPQLTLSRLRQIAGRMRGPLGNLIGASQLLEQQDSDAPSEKLKQYRGIQRKNYLILQRMLESMEQLGALAEGDVPVNEVLDFGGLCSRVVRQAEGLFEVLKVGLTLEQVDGNLLVEGESHLLSQLLYQLLSNALRAAQNTQESSVRLRLERVRRDHLRLTINDSGSGFATDQLAMAFDPSQAPEAFGERGLGLGIALCRAIVQRCGGRIALLDGPGGRVIVELPLVKPSAQSDQSMGSNFGYSTGSDDVMTQFADLLPWQCYTEEFGAF
jgi:signal transduction histidine kinase